MASTAFTHAIKVHECPSCGAPCVAPPAGGAVTCQYCGVSAQILARREETAHTMPEPERLESLRAQLAAGKPHPTLHERVPAPLQDIVRDFAEPARRQELLPRARQVWQAARGAAGSSPTADQAVDLFHTARHLAHMYWITADGERARATLETAIELLPMREMRDVLRCLLARYALLVGDRPAFERWLADCDARPTVLEVESELRLTKALGAMLAGGADAVLTLVGRTPGEAPLSADAEPLASALRAHACAARGDAPAALGHMGQIAKKLGTAAAKGVFKVYPGPATELVSDMERAHVARVETEARSTRRANVGCIAILVVLVLGFAFGAPTLCRVVDPDLASVPGDAEHFDPLRALPDVTEMAGPGAQIVSIDAAFVRPDGTMDLTQPFGPYVKYELVRPSDDEAPALPLGVPATQGTLDTVWVEVRDEGNVGDLCNEDLEETGMWRRVAEGYAHSGSIPVPPPACPFTMIWQQAIARGAPPDAVAVINYSATMWHNAPLIRYRFHIEGIFHMELDSGCRLVE